MTALDRWTAVLLLVCGLIIGAGLARIVDARTARPAAPCPDGCPPPCAERSRQETRGPSGAVASRPAAGAAHAGPTAADGPP